MFVSVCIGRDVISDASRRKNASKRLTGTVAPVIMMVMVVMPTAGSSERIAFGETSGVGQLTGDLLGNGNIIGRSRDHCSGGEKGKDGHKDDVEEKHDEGGRFVKRM